MYKSCSHRPSLHFKPGMGTFGKKALHINVVGREDRRRMTTMAALEAEAALAVSQQIITFGAVVGAEALYTRTQIPEGGGGRPELFATGIGTGLFIVSGLLIGSALDLLEPVGLVLGLGTTVYFLSNLYSRFKTLESDPYSWPGPRMWPVGMGVGNFLVFLAILEAFKGFK